VQIVYLNPPIRLTKVVCHNPRSIEVLVFPTTATICGWPFGVLHYIIGFENSLEDGTDGLFKFILSNGARSQGRDDDCTYYDHMMPTGSHNKIRSVTIHHDDECIDGFSFFDKEGALLWKIGWTTGSYLKVETVLIAEDERIIGVVAKL
jgi:hypothetical protein